MRDIVFAFAALALFLPNITLAQDKKTSDLRLGTNDRLIASGGPGIAGVAFSPDGRWLAYAGAGKAVNIFDLAAGKKVREFDGYNGFIRTVAFSPDGRLLATAGDDPGIILWEFATGKKIPKIGHHGAHLRMAAFSPDGATLVSSGFDEHIGLWNLATGAKLQFFRAHARVPYSVAFSPDGKILASGGDKVGVVRLWDVANAQEIGTLLGHQGPVHSVMFSPNGRLLATGGDDIRVWELDSGQQVRKMPGINAMTTSRLVFSPDGRTLASNNHSNTVHVWELASSSGIQRFGTHSGILWGLAYSPSGKQLVSSDKDGNVVLWDLQSIVFLGDTKGLPPVRPMPAALRDAWTTLGGADAAKAYDSILALAKSDPSVVVPFMRDRLRPASAVVVTKAKLDRLIRDLADDQFRVRDKAMADLGDLGIAALPALRAALAKHESLEADRRIALLLSKIDAAGRTPECLQSIRALRILEDFDTPEGRRIVEDLAAGASGDRLTMEAQRALSRMTARVGK